MKKNKRVVILHNPVLPDAPEDDKNLLDQVNAVRQALKKLRYEPTVVTFDLNIPRTIDLIWEADPCCVFNLVESVSDDSRLLHWGASLLDHLGIPYTGCPTEALFISTNKILAKRVLRGAGFQTAPWVSQDDCTMPPGKHTFIIKSNWDHASSWFTEDAIVTVKTSAIRDLLNERRIRTGREYFAEHYIDGREFNVAVLAGQVLPVPEIRFLDYPDGKYKVVDYQAKWDEESFEFLHTERSFDFEPEERPLLRQLSEIAEHCWQTFGLGGYARVDFRVDPQGQPWVLEVNANPCIAPYSGFAAAAARVGLNYTQMIRCIVRDALDRHAVEGNREPRICPVS